MIKEQKPDAGWERNARNMSGKSMSEINHLKEQAKKDRRLKAEAQAASRDRYYEQMPFVLERRQGRDDTFLSSKIKTVLPDFHKFSQAIHSKPYHIYLGLDDTDPANSHHEVNINELEKVLANGQINNIIATSKGKNGTTNNHHHPAAAVVVTNEKVGRQHHKQKKDAKEKDKEKESPSKKVRDAAKHGNIKSPLKTKPPSIQMPKRNLQELLVKTPDKKIESILKEMTKMDPPLTDIETPGKVHGKEFAFPLPPSKATASEKEEQKSKKELQKENIKKRKETQKAREQKIQEKKKSPAKVMGRLSEHDPRALEDKSEKATSITKKPVSTMLDIVNSSSNNKNRLSSSSSSSSDDGSSSDSDSDSDSDSSDSEDESAKKPQEAPAKATKETNNKKPPPTTTTSLNKKQKIKTKTALLQTDKKGSPLNNNYLIDKNNTSNMLHSTAVTLTSATTTSTATTGPNADLNLDSIKSEPPTEVDSKHSTTTNLNSVAMKEDISHDNTLLNSATGGSQDISQLAMPLIFGGANHHTVGGDKFNVNDANSMLLEEIEKPLSPFPLFGDLDYSGNNFIGENLLYTTQDLGKDLKPPPHNIEPPPPQPPPAATTKDSVDTFPLDNDSSENSLILHNKKTNGVLYKKDSKKGRKPSKTKDSSSTKDKKSDERNKQNSKSNETKDKSKSKNTRIDSSSSLASVKVTSGSNGQPFKTKAELKMASLSQANTSSETSKTNNSSNDDILVNNDRKIDSITPSPSSKTKASQRPGSKSSSKSDNLFKNNKKENNSSSNSSKKEKLEITDGLILDDVFVEPSTVKTSSSVSTETGSTTTTVTQSSLSTPFMKSSNPLVKSSTIANDSQHNTHAQKVLPQLAPTFKPVQQQVPGTLPTFKPIPETTTGSFHPTINTTPTFKPIPESEIKTEENALLTLKPIPESVVPLTDSSPAFKPISSQSSKLLFENSLTQALKPIPESFKPFGGENDFQPLQPSQANDHTAATLDLTKITPTTTIDSKILETLKSPNVSVGGGMKSSPSQLPDLSFFRAPTTNSLQDLENLVNKRHTDTPPESEHNQILDDLTKLVNEPVVESHPDICIESIIKQGHNIFEEHPNAALSSLLSPMESPKHVLKFEVPRFNNNNNSQQQQKELSNSNLQHQQPQHHHHHHHHHHHQQQQQQYQLNYQHHNQQQQQQKLEPFDDEKPPDIPLDEKPPDILLNIRPPDVSLSINTSDSFLSEQKADVSKIPGIPLNFSASEIIATTNYSVSVPIIVNNQNNRIPHLHTSISGSVPLIGNNLNSSILPLHTNISGSVPLTGNNLNSSIPPLHTNISGSVSLTGNNLNSSIPPLHTNISGSVPLIGNNLNSSILPLNSSISDSLPLIGNDLHNSIPPLHTSISCSVPLIGNNLHNSIPPLYTSIPCSVPLISNNLHNDTPPLHTSLPGVSLSGSLSHIPLNAYTNISQTYNHNNNSTDKPQHLFMPPKNLVITEMPFISPREETMEDVVRPPISFLSPPSTSTPNTRKQQQTPVVADTFKVESGFAEVKEIKQEPEEPPPVVGVDIGDGAMNQHHHLDDTLDFAVQPSLLDTLLEQSKNQQEIKVKTEEEISAEPPPAKIPKPNSFVDNNKDVPSPGNCFDFIKDEVNKLPERLVVKIPLSRIKLKDISLPNYKNRTSTNATTISTSTTKQQHNNQLKRKHLDRSTTNKYHQQNSNKSPNRGDEDEDIDILGLNSPLKRSRRLSEVQDSVAKKVSIEAGSCGSGEEDEEDTPLYAINDTLNDSMTKKDLVVRINLNWLRRIPNCLSQKKASRPKPKKSKPEKSLLKAESIDEKVVYGEINGDLTTKVTEAESAAATDKRKKRVISSNAADVKEEENSPAPEKASTESGEMKRADVNFCTECGVMRTDGGRDHQRLARYKKSYITYINEGRRRKHQADSLKSDVDKSHAYIDAVLNYVKYLVGLEQSSGKMSSSEGVGEYMKVTSECISLVEYVVTRKINRAANSYDKRFLFLCLRLESILYLKLYKMKKDSTMRNAKLLTEYYKQYKPANLIGRSPFSKSSNQRGSTGTPSPSSPSPGPSPGGSVASIGSAGSIGSTGCNEKSGPGMVTLPGDMHEKGYQYFQQTKHLLHGHRLWDEADGLTNYIQPFITNLSKTAGVLSMQSSMLQVVDYISGGLQLIKDLTSKT